MKLAVHYCYSNFIHHLSLLSYKCINEPESDDDKHRVESEWKIYGWCVYRALIMLSVVGIQVSENNQAEKVCSMK